MESDIKLDRHLVVIEATDLVLNANERRNPNGPADGYRRALVHGPGDQLVINYDGDYPGGVSIFGRVHLAGPGPQSAVPTGTESDITIDPRAKDRLKNLQTNLERQLKQERGIDHSALPVDIPALFADDKAAVELTAEIRRLRRAILDLDSRLKAVEAKG
jgi:hypothetical protein